MRLDKAKEEGREENQIQTVLKLHGKAKSIAEIVDLLDISGDEVMQIVENRLQK